MATNTVLITSSASSVDVSTLLPNIDTSQNVTIVCIGGGGGAGLQKAGECGGGGGGGGWSSSSISLSGVSTVNYSVGAAGSGTSTPETAGTNGGQTWFNKSANSAPTVNTNGALANGGSGGSSAGAGGAGATTTGAIGTTTNAGGTGGTGGASNNSGGAGGEFKYSTLNPTKPCATNLFTY